MKKVLKIVIPIVLIVVAVLGFKNYQRLNIITGYASKSVASGVFLANRSQESVEKGDNDFSPINLANNQVDQDNSKVVTDVFGLMEREAIFVEGLGAVLINDSYNPSHQFVKPQRVQPLKELAYPYGNLPQKDTVFETVNYNALNQAVQNAFDKAGEQKKRTRAVLVIYKDQIIAEQYGEGFNKETEMLGWSMTKSITATMYGIMQQKGMLNIDNPAPIEFWVNDERAAITYNDLLHMNSGLEWTEDYYQMSDVTRMLFLESDMAKTQMEKPLVGEINNSWNYSSGTSNLLAGKLMRDQFKTQQAYINFWYQEFIDKIGMYSAIVEPDLSGNLVGSSYGWATTRDWGKFGLFYLHRGNWQGEQIVDSSFVDYVSTPTHGSDGRYGGHFWLNAHGFYPDVPKDLFSANGFQGQMVAIIPSKDMVIVRFGLVEHPEFDFNKFLKEITESVN